MTKVYRVKPWVRWSTVAASLVLAFASAVWMVATVAEAPPRWQGTAALAGLLFAFLVFSAVAVLRSRVELHEDHLVIVGAIRRRRIARADMTSWRQIPGHSTLQIFTRGTQNAGYVLPEQLAIDAAFGAWFGDLPNRDHQAAMASLDRVLADRELEGGRAERMAAIERARRVGMRLTVGGTVVSLWALVWPTPYIPLMLLLLSLPWTSTLLAAHAGAYYRFDTRDGEVTTNVALPLILPAMTVVMRVFLDIQLVEWSFALGLSAALAAVFVAAQVASVTELREKPSALWLPAICMASTAFGLVMFANRELDFAPTRQMSVASAPDGSAKQDEPMCEHIGPGALGIAWKFVAPCAPLKPKN
jgi:hypothetical protein